MTSLRHAIRERFDLMLHGYTPTVAYKNGRYTVFLCYSKDMIERLGYEVVI